MIDSLKRAWCRSMHQGEYLRPSLVGGGSLRCARCGAGFVDLADGGTLRLDEYERELSAGAGAVIERAAAAAAPVQLEGGVYRVLRGGKAVKIGRIA